MTDPLDVLHGKDPGPPNPPKLPFWASIGEAYRLWFHHFGLVMRVAGPWMAIVFLPLAAIMWMQTPDLMTVMAGLARGEPQMLPHPLMQAGWGIVSKLWMLPAISSVAVAWHRRLLLDEEPKPGLYLRLDSVVTGYGVMALILGVMTSLPGFLVLAAQEGAGPKPTLAFGAVSTILGAIGIVMMVLVARFSLALPAKALSHADATLGAAWRMTRGNTWRMICGYFFCLLPWGVLAYLMERATFTPDASRLAVTLMLAVSTVLWMPFGLVGLGFLSVSYRHFTQAAAPPA